MTWESLRDEVSLCAMGREVALPCRASFELHPPINQQRILSWGRCGAVVLLAEPAFLWQREGAHPHTSINQEFLLISDNFPFPTGKNGKKSRERLLKSSCSGGFILLDHLQGRGNSLQEQFLNDGEESNLNLNLIL